MKKSGKAKRIIALALLIVAVAMAVTCVYVCVVAFSVKLEPSKLVNKDRSLAVLNAEGDDMRDRLGYVEYDQIPANLANAFVAVEDKRFYRHHGVDLVRIGGAAVANVKHRDVVQGASTITCQLIKNTHLNNQRTLRRKIQEAKLALELEKRYDKEEILTMYLNVIYFGSGLYGVGDAAKSFFGKQVQDLSLAECASIAATTVNPARYSPRLSPDNNRERRNMVLRLMLEQNYIDEQAYEQAVKGELVLCESVPKLYESYFINAIDEAERMTGLSYAQLCGGYKVYTYCDEADQQACTQTLCEQEQMTMICTADGMITGFAANYQLRQSEIRRQIGSTIKPFVYACAIERQCLLPESILTDEPTDFGGYAPKNYHENYLGKTTAREALAKSSNVAACKVLSYAGVEEAYTFCIDCGLPLSKKDKHMGLALGGLTYGVRADELAGAYTTLANGGVHSPARFVKKIVAQDGSVIYQDKPKARQTMRASTAYLVSDMLQNTVSEGTAKPLGVLSGEVAAKTGTVAGKRGNTDAWCVAYNSRYIALSWCGNLSMKEENDVNTNGGGTPCLAVKRVLYGHQGYTFGIVDDVEYADIDLEDWQQKSVLARCTNNTPLRYRMTIAIPRGYPLQQSANFAYAATPDATFSVVEDCVRLTLPASPHYTYYVVVDEGFATTPIDSFEGNGNLVFDYPYRGGQWRIYGVLHGKFDVTSPSYGVYIL